MPAWTATSEVALFDDPRAAPVNDRIAEQTVHVAEFADGNTWASVHVVTVPVYDQTVRAGLQSVGAITDTKPLGVVC